MTHAASASMRFVDALAVVSTWAALGGRREVELGALEPTLWYDGEWRLPDLVHALCQRGFRVTMTTNASLLPSLGDELKSAGLSALRISWHTTDRGRYTEMTSGGDYDRFLAGVAAAISSGLPIAFNRLLLKGHTEDVSEQVSFIESHGLRLKLYDLLWAPQIAAEYPTFYEDWRPIVRRYVLPRTRYIERFRPMAGRPRLRFHIAGRAVVEVKISDGIDRTRQPCRTCCFHSFCGEQWGDYVRVGPDLRAHFCYLRQNIGFTFRGGDGTALAPPATIQAELETVLGARARDILAATPLRFIITKHCNYHCVFPGTSVSWCHKSFRDFPGTDWSRSP